MGTTEEIKERPVWEVLALSIIGMVIGLFIGSFAGLLVAGLISGNGLAVIANQSFSKTDLLIIQGFTSTFGLLVFPFIAYSKICRISPNSFFKSGVTPISILSLLFIVISFSIGLSVIIEWNQNIHFPGFLKSFEEWARLKEDELEALTKTLAQFDSFGYFLLGLLVIGVVAAVTEEYLFRGILQTQILRWTKNHHVAIWITAILLVPFMYNFLDLSPEYCLEHCLDTYMYGLEI